MMIKYIRTIKIMLVLYNEASRRFGTESILPAVGCEAAARACSELGSAITTPPHGRVFLYTIRFLQERQEGLHVTIKSLRSSVLIQIVSGGR